MRMHRDQLEVTVDMVRELVADQFPAWAGLAIDPVRSEGTVNAIFRLGDRLAARFPLQPGDVDTTRARLESEAAAAQELSQHTRFAVPEPVGIGEPGARFPLPWSVQTWLPGMTATQRDPSTSPGFAHDLAALIQDVRAIPLRGRRFDRDGRGGDLASHDDWVQECLRRSEQLLDIRPLRRMWDRFRELPRESPDVMNHGDLVPGNVLVSAGRLAGVLDAGGLGAADPALDLVGAWHLLDARPRHPLRRELGCGELEWERGKAWAFEQAIGAVWYYVHSNSAMFRMGQTTLARLLADEDAH